MTTQKHREVVEQALNLVAGPNWGTVGYMDMQVYDDASKLEKQLRAALTEQVQPCIGKDPLCPCQDGDACHYKDAEDTKALPVKVEQVQPHESYYDKQSLRDVLEQAARIAFNANCPGGDDYAHGYNKAAKYIERAIRAMIGEIK